MDLTEVYQAWERKWELVNPKPNIQFDKIIMVLLFMVILGSVFLSGSRTGNVVAEIASLANLAQKANYLGLSRGTFIAIEAFLGFLTFESGILLAGYLMSENTDMKVKKEYWYLVLLVSAFIPALFSNIYPGWQLIEQSNESLSGIGQIIVDGIVGILTPIMSFLSGSVLAVVNRDRKNRVEKIETEYQEKKKKAWERSKEYRSYLKKDKPVKQQENKNAYQEYLTLLPATISDLSSNLNVSQSTVYRIVRELENKNLAERNGETVEII